MDEQNVKRVVVAGAVAGLLVIVGVWFTWGRQPPQIGGNKEAYKVVEGLFTALSSKSPTRLADCEERLHALRDAGQVAGPASDYLDSLIRDARAGKWRQATKQIFVFMKAQRRPDA